MGSDRYRGRSAGFTLIEAVVALLIVALGMTAVYMQLNQFAVNAIYLQDKTIASWIGSNIVTEYSLRTSWPEIEETEDELKDFAGRDWHLLIRVEETEVEDLRRVDVSVALADNPDLVIHTVSGLLEPPVPAGLPPVSYRSVEQGIESGGRGGRGRGFSPAGSGVPARGPGG